MKLCLFFEKNKQINKPLIRIIKKKWVQINKIRNERREITTNTAETQRIIKVYYEQIYVNKLDNLEEMDKLLEIYNLSRLNHEEIENLNRPMTWDEIESVSKKLPQNRSSGPDGFAGEFYQTFQEELIPIVVKLFPKTEVAWTHPNTFYESRITLI